MRYNSDTLYRPQNFELGPKKLELYSVINSRARPHVKGTDGQSDGYAQPNIPPFHGRLLHILMSHIDKLVLYVLCIVKPIYESIFS